MRALRFAVGLAVAVPLHVLGVSLVPALPRAVDLFLVLAVLNGLGGGALAGLGGGVAAGLVADALTGGIYGLHGFADTIIGYGTAVAAQRLVIQRAAGVALLFALAAAVQQAVLAVLMLLLFQAPELPQVPWIFVKAGTSAALGVLLFTVREQLLTRSERWRRSRTRKLRFDR